MPAPRWLSRLVRRTRLRVLIVGAIFRHPETPWYVWVCALAVVAYAASPIDLIPDFIPVLGQIDDLLLLPLGIAVVLRLTPVKVRREAMRAALRREQAFSRGGETG